MSFFKELKRRNVFRVGAAYLVAAWLLLQIVDVVGPILGLPDVLTRYLLFLLVVGFIPAIVIAWAFELTPEGVKREDEVNRSRSSTQRTGHKLDRAIMVVLALAVGFLLFDKLLLQNDPETPGSKLARKALPESGHLETRLPSAETGGKSVAVLPFVAMSNGPDDDYFADGLTEEIINSLAQLPTLLVTARTSAFHFKGQNLPVSEIAGRLGVGHVVEGSVRRAGEQLRITAQLIRAQDGFHLWSETYDRRTEDTFTVQEDIAEKIATALDVVLDDTMRQQMRRAGVRNVEAFIEYQKGRELFGKAHSNDNLISLLRQANQHFENAVALAPEFADAHLSTTDLYTHILMRRADGTLDGNITDEDYRNARPALERQYDLAIEHASSTGQRLATQFDRALTLGHWVGLSRLADRLLVDTGCESAFWLQLATAPFGKAVALYESFKQTAACDPLQYRPWVHMTRAKIWSGDVPGALATGEQALRTLEGETSWGVRSYVLALMLAGKVSEAKQVAETRIKAENERLIARFMIAALEGDPKAMATLQMDYLSRFGPNDTTSLVMESLRGRRNEANRLASVIDGRPSGYLSLMQAVFWCSCGAPFDLDATPVFATMLGKSGLEWPPEKAINFPLKSW